MNRMIDFMEWLWRRPVISIWLVFAIAMSLFVSSFWFVEKCSVVDYPIRDLKNRDMAAERAVKDSAIDFSDPVFLFMRIFPRIEKDSLWALIEFVDRAEDYFSKHGLKDKIAISSLANVVDYDSDDVGSSFISKEKLADKSFDVRKWAEKNLIRIDVDGGLAGNVPGEYEYFLVSFFPVQDFPEIKMYEIVQSFLKGEDLSIWELYLFPNLKIDPSFFEVGGRKVDMTIEPLGWSEGRGEVDVQSNAETWIKAFGGILWLSTMLLFFLLLPWQAGVALVIITIAFLSNRGLIGVFDQISLWMNNGYRYLEDVFSILNSPSSLIAGFSYPLRSFYKFNLEVKRKLALIGEIGKMSDETYWDCWRGAFKKVFPAITLVTTIAVQDYINFMGLQQLHGSRSMWQVAIFSATGLLISYLLTAVFLPPFYRLIGGKKLSPYVKRFSGKNKGWITRPSRWVDKAISGISGYFLRRAVKKGPSLPLKAFTAVIIMAIVMLGSGMLITDSKPEELLDPVPMGHTVRELRKPGRPGFNINQVYIKEDLTDPAVLDRIWKYSMEMKKAGRTMFGPLNFFLAILMRDVSQYHLGGSIEESIAQFVSEDMGDNPSSERIKEESRAFVRDIWNDILDQKSMELLMSHFLTRDLGQMITIFTYAGAKATEMAAYVNLSYLKAEDYGIHVLVPTKLAQYAEVDRMISQGPFNTPPPWGMLLNDAMSQMTIVLIVILVFWYRNGRYAKINPLAGGMLVVVPFIFSSMFVLLVMAFYQIPYDVASASIRCITVSVAVDLPIFFIFGFQSLLSEEKGSFEKAMGGEGMRHEADEVFVDFVVNSMAFVFLILSGFPTVHRLGIMLVVSMIMFFIGTMWITAPLMKYLVRPVSASEFVPVKGILPKTND